MNDIIKAYLQSPRTWATITAIAVAVTQGNKLGITPEQVAWMVSLVSSAFVVGASIRPPRLSTPPTLPATNVAA